MRTNPRFIVATIVVATLVSSCGSTQNPDSPYPDYTATFLQGPPNQDYM